VAAAAGALGLRPDDELRRAYEDAQDGLSGATTIADAELEALDAIAAAQASTDATPDLLTQVGLLGDVPRAGYDAARSAFEAGQLDEAERSARATVALLATAPAIGRDRILAVGGGALAVLLVLATLALLMRRRRAERRARVLATATLAADAAAAPAPPGAGPSDAVGDHGSDDAPAGP
ncbi:MAG: hypothetical protein ACRDMZ_03295, partial [Solirubrobacteraceae bacterium]